SRRGSCRAPRTGWTLRPSGSGQRVVDRRERPVTGEGDLDLAERGVLATGGLPVRDGLALVRLRQPLPVHVPQVDEVGLPVLEVRQPDGLVNRVVLLRRLVGLAADSDGQLPRLRGLRVARPALAVVVRR